MVVDEGDPARMSKGKLYRPEPHNTHVLIPAYLRGDLARERLVRTLLEGVLAVFVAFAPAGITQTRHTCMWISVRVVQHGVCVCCGVGVGVCARAIHISFASGIYSNAPLAGVFRRRSMSVSAMYT